MCYPWSERSFGSLRQELQWGSSSTPVSTVGGDKLQSESKRWQTCLRIESLQTNPPSITSESTVLVNFWFVEWRSKVKRYHVLFTCLTTRVIHIEVVYSLDTDSFINSMHRFIARRGEPEQMGSDNGRNFVRGKKELLEHGSDHRIPPPTKRSVDFQPPCRRVVPNTLISGRLPAGNLLILH